MADWSNPTLSSTYTNFLNDLKSRDVDLALLFDGTGTNIPTGAIQWNSSTSTFRKWSGSAWSNQIIGIAGGGSGSGTAAGARTNFGLEIGTNVQAYNAKLQNISSVTFAADQIAYFTNATSVASTTLTSFARTLLDDNSAAAMQATLGLSIGSNIQAYSSTLQSISGVSATVDRILYTVATNSYSSTPLTSFARTLLDDTDANTMRATLGITIGTQVQAYNVKLQSLSSTVFAADRLPYFTDANTIASATFTSSGRIIISQPSIAAATRALDVYAGRYDAGSLTFPSGWTVSNPSTGNYTITHNKGNSSYTVSATAMTPSFGITVEITSLTSNSFGLRFRHSTTDTNVNVDPFLFTVIFTAP